MEEESRLEEVLEKFPLFCGCHFPTEEMILKNCRKGQFISDKVHGLEMLGFVLEGYIDVYSVAFDGHEVLLTGLASGDCFGLVNLLVKNEFPTVLKCRKKTKILLLPKQVVVKLLETDAAFALRYAGFCGKKLQFLLKRIELLTMQSGRNKVIQYLLMRKDHRGLVQLECTKEQLAAILGISRASLFRELAALQEQGLIVPEKAGAFWLTDPNRLEAICYECT